MNLETASDAALARILAIAVQRGSGLELAVEAFASEHGRFQRTRLMKLARELADRPLSDIAVDRPQLLPLDVRSAVRYGSQIGRLQEVLDMTANQLTTQRPLQSQFRVPLIQLRSLLVLLVFSSILSFFTFNIIPKFKAIFNGFGIEMPSLTRLVMRFSESWAVTGVAGSVLLVLSYFYFLAHPLARSNFFGGRSNWLLTFGSRRRAALPGILRYLRVAIESQVPISAALDALSKSFIHPAVARELAKARELVDQGYSPWESLRRVKLFRPSEVAVCDRAQQVGNLPWALTELAETIERRHAYVTQWTFELLQPLPIIALGLVAAFTCIGLFMPLIKVIQVLSLSTNP